MPHIPKGATHPYRPQQLSSQGSAARPELLFGSRAPQAKQAIPVRQPPKRVGSKKLAMNRINPMTYDGPETHPDAVYKSLFGKDFKENDYGVAQT